MPPPPRLCRFCRNRAAHPGGAGQAGSCGHRKRGVLALSLLVIGLFSMRTAVTLPLSHPAYRAVGIGLQGPPTLLFPHLSVLCGAVSGAAHWSSVIFLLRGMKSASNLGSSDAGVVSSRGLARLCFRYLVFGLSSTPSCVEGEHSSRVNSHVCYFVTHVIAGDSDGFFRCTVGHLPLRCCMPVDLGRMSDTANFTSPSGRSAS